MTLIQLQSKEVARLKQTILKMNFSVFTLKNELQWEQTICLILGLTKTEIKEDIKCFEIVFQIKHFMEITNLQNVITGFFGGLNRAATEYQKALPFQNCRG